MRQFVCRSCTFRSSARVCYQAFKTQDPLTVRRYNPFVLHVAIWGPQRPRLVARLHRGYPQEAIGSIIVMLLKDHQHWIFEGVCLIQSTFFSIEVIRQRSDLKDLEEKAIEIHQWHLASFKRWDFRRSQPFSWLEKSSCDSARIVLPSNSLKKGPSGLDHAS